MLNEDDPAGCASSEETRRLERIVDDGRTVTIHLDGGELYELAHVSVPAALPPVGGSVSSPLLAAIRLGAERKLVARRVLAMIARRLQPMARLRRRLVKAGFSGEAVDQVLAEVAASGLHSDRVYAAAYCRDTLARRPVGRAYLLNKLRGQGIPAKLAAAVVAEELASDRETELATEAAVKRWRRERNGTDRRAEARVVRFLIGRGFAPGLARVVARRAAPLPGEPSSQATEEADS